MEGSISILIIAETRGKDTLADNAITDTVAISENAVSVTGIRCRGRTS